MMKKLFFAVVCLLTMMGAQAQETGSLLIRPMGGLSVTGIRGDGADGTKYTLGGVLGGELEYRVARPVGLSAGAMISWQGFDLDTDGYDASFDLTYLTIPVLLNYYITDNFAIKAGVQPGFLVNSNLNLKRNNDKAELDAEKIFKKFDLAIPMGCSYSFSNFQIDARYNLSVTKLLKKGTINGVEFSGDGNAYNSVVQVTLGYNFRLK